MKKLLSGLAVAVIGLGSIGQGAVLDDAVQYLYQKGYTIYNTTTAYKANNYMRRDEAAKFFVKIAKDMNVSYTKTEAQCSFPDLNEGHADLKNDIIESCRMGIFQGGNGKFNPTGSLTNAQAITVLLRIVSGRESEVGVTHWADNYYNKAYTLGYLSALPVLNNKDGLATRGTVAQLVYNYFKQKNNNDIGGNVQQFKVFTDNTLKLSFKYPDYIDISYDDYGTDEFITLIMKNNGKKDALGNTIVELERSEFLISNKQMSSVNSLSDLESFCNNYNENICTLKVNSNGIKYIRYKSDEYGGVISWLFYNPDNTFYKLISLSTTIGLSTADKNIVEYMVESLQFIK